MSLRVAIAGTGFIGAVHAQAVRATGGTVAGVLASTPERSQQAAERLGAEHSYANADALIADDSVDVVHVCSPNNTHEDLAARALDAGRHVVCEKPLATDLEGAERLVARASATHAVAAVPFAYRYYPTVREARNRIATGQSGTVNLIHGTYLQDWLLEPGDDNWRVDPDLGGESRAFADIGSHWCDLAEFVTGHRITRLCANTKSVNGRETEDAVTLQFETDGGALGSAVISQISAGRKNRLWLEIDAANEALNFDQENAESLWVGGRNATTIIRKDAAVMSPQAARLATLPAGHPQGYQDCFNLFVADVGAAIQSGDAPDGLPTFSDGLRAARITGAVLASAREGQWIDVAPAVVL